jgi:predicted TIM-barrel fold metal-dependent hydrolase
MTSIPRIVSVDDHVLEPPNLWSERLPARYRESAPRVERYFGYIDFEHKEKAQFESRGHLEFVYDEEKASPKSRWCDHWVYEDMRWPIPAGFAGVRKDPQGRRVEAFEGICYDDMRAGCYEQASRLADMDLNHVEASLSFPSMPRFCGQTFLERQDKALALLCLRIYNDWMIDEWCAGDGRGRLIPQTLVPLWDVELAAAEVRRCAGKGSHAIAFSEIPAYLGLPSIHTRYWDPLFAACEETETVVNMHIGSASTKVVTSADAPPVVVAALNTQPAMSGFVDWIFSGTLARFSRLRIAFSEGQVGWMPFVIERLESLWRRSDDYMDGLHDTVPKPPSSYLDRIYGCIFDDVHALISRESIGMSQIMFEVDYPHNDSTFPNSRETAERMVAMAGLTERESRQLVRGNAIECYQLQRFGVES